MFQTDLNHFLQSFANDWLTNFMILMTRLGYAGFLLLFSVVLVFAFDFKKGFLILQILLWTALITLFFKNLFAYPRPFHVDPSLKMLDAELPDQSQRLSTPKDAPDFFSPLPAEVVTHFQQQKDISYGLPSGHTSVAAALWRSLMYFYTRLWLHYMCIALIVLVPLSRIYLGVHFLGDVLLGYAIGFGTLALFYYTSIRKMTWEELLSQKIWQTNLVGFGYLIGLPILFTFVLKGRESVLASYLLGINLAYILLKIKGLPIKQGGFWQGLGRVVVAVSLFLLSSLIITQILKALGLAENIGALYIQNLLAIFIFLWGGVELSVKLGWYKRELAEA
jgi:membrane-associated phospholipid phosphatase